ncbi:MAG: hypothetical protein ACLTJ5_00965 [Clostridium sp.]
MIRIFDEAAFIAEWSNAAIEAENVVAALIANKGIKKSDMDEVRFGKDRLFADISGLREELRLMIVLKCGRFTGLQRWLDES